MFNKKKIEALSSRVKKLEELKDSEDLVKQKHIHARCKLCGVTDFKDNLVKVTPNLEVEGKRRGYDVISETSYSNSYGFHFGPADYVHAKCMGITKSDDEAGWNFKKKPLPVKEEK
jgi:hypothetical protein